MSLYQFITILLVLQSTSCFIQKDLIMEFSKNKHFTIGTIFLCSKKSEKVQMARNFYNKGLRLLFADVTMTSDVGKTLQKNHNNFGVILDGDCKTSHDFLNQINQSFFFETYHWLVMCNSLTLGVDILNSTALNINSDVHLAVPETHKFESFIIYDVYNPAYKHGGQLKVHFWGWYNKTGGYHRMMDDKNKYLVRRNMTGATFKSAIVIPQLYMELEDYLASEENKQINSMHRFQSVTINHCRDFYNFSLDMQRTDSWGYIQADGHFNGLVRLLELRLVDFGSSPLIYKLDRMPVVDYSFGNWILRSAFIYRRPKVIPESYKIFLRPLSKNAWITIVVFMGIILLALKIIFASESNFLSKLHNSVDSSWSFLLLFTLGAFCQQGATCYPKLFSSRILSIFVFLFCILIYQFYSASIVSYLLMDPPRTINNLEDLVNSKLRAGIEDILIDRDYFVQTTDPNALNLFQLKIKGDTNDSGFYSPADGLDLVRQGGFAFHVETSTAYPIIEETFSNEEICELEEVQMYRTQPMHTNLQKHSPFRDMLNYCMLKLVEDGNMYRLRKYWDARKPACIESAKKTEIHVTMKEFLSGPIVLSFGICFSLVFLLGECVWFRRKYIIDFFYVPQEEFIQYPFTN